MTRSLRRRVAAVWRKTGHDSQAVLAAFHELRRTGSAPPGPAGAEAAKCREESARHFDEDLLREHWVELRVTGLGLAECAMLGRGAGSD